MNRAQLGFGKVFVMMVIFVFLVVGKRGELTQAEQQEQTCDFLHRNPPRAATRILVMLESRVKRPCGRSGRAQACLDSLCDTEYMQSPLHLPTAATDPKSVKVNLTSGTGVDIEWNDGHVSHYSFVYLRDACPCAMCEEERGKAGRRPGEPVGSPPGQLVIFKPAAKPVSAEGVGKYAIKFSWNDGHDLGIYSWKFLREVCPCEECKKSLAAH